MKQSIEIFNTTDQIAIRFREILLETQEKMQNELVLSGGSTPKPILQYLAAHPGGISWNKIQFYWGDERCVRPDDSDSNYRMARESLFEKIKIAKNQIHRIHGENSPENEAGRYAGEIHKYVAFKRSLPSFGLIMLGLGEDGHTASIFPDRLALFNSDEICSVAIHPETGQKRITLTGKVLNNASHVIFLVTGKSKARVFSRIINQKNDFRKFPAAHILPEKGKLYWLIDKEAASEL